MKKKGFFFALAMLLLLGSGNLWATPVMLNEVGVNPSAVVSVTIPGLGTLSVLAGEYILDIQGWGTFAGFCVDPVYSPTSYQQYYLNPVPDEINYERAAYLFSKYGSAFTGSTNQAIAANVQLAIWELMFETNGTFNTSDGGFKVNNSGWAASSQLYVGEAELADLSSFHPNQDGIIVAMNPQAGYGTGYQDYMIRAVPEPSSLLLLGSGFVGLGLWGRRKFKARS